MRRLTATCLTLLVLFGAWAFADPKQAEIVVTVQSLDGDDINGLLRVDEMKASIADIARHGDVVFSGGLVPATRFLMDRGARPLDIKVSGQITIPGRDPERLKFSQICQGHLMLHTGKWSVEVIGPKAFKPDAVEQ